MKISGQRRVHALAAAGTLAGLLCLAAEAATSALDSPAFSLAPADLLRTARQAPPVADRSVTFLLIEQRYEIDAEQRLTETIRQVRRIDDENLDPVFSQVIAAWEPARQRRPEVRARTITATGEVRDLDPATLSEEGLGSGDPRTHWDLRMLRGPLPALGPGSVVEFETKMVDERAPVPAGRLFSVALPLDPSLLRTRVVVSVPASMPFRHTLTNAARAHVDESLRDGRRELVVDFESGSAAGEDAVGDRAPVLRFSTGADWSEIARAYHSITAPLIRPDEVRALLPANLPVERDARIGSVLDLLHREVRYTAAAFGANRFVPQPPSITLARGYGDCKDKSVLLVSLLRAAGIEADLALLNVSDDVDTDPSLPGFGNFDHLIVHVPGPSELWIDATAAGYDVGDLPYPDKGRAVLLIDPVTTALVWTPPPRAADNTMDEQMDLRLRDHGPMDGRVTSQLSPEGSVTLRADASLRARRAEGAREHFGAERVLESRWEGLDARGPLTEISEFFGSGYGKTDFDTASASLSFVDLMNNVPQELRAADSDDSDEDGAVPLLRALRFVPYVQSRTVRVIPPEGFRPDALPAPLTLQLGPATFSRQITADESGVVTVALRFDTGDGAYSPDDASRFRDAYRRDVAGQAIDIRFTHEAAARMTAGDAAGALLRHAELSASHPKAAIHDVRWSRALMELRLVADARRAAERAIRKEPDAAVGHVQLGYVLQHDRFGRFRYEGFDRDGAVRAFRAALRYGPDDPYVHEQLAELLRFNGAGIPLGDGADLPGAVEQRRWLVERKPGDYIAVLKMYAAMFEAGEFEQILARAAARAEPSRDLLVAAYVLAVRVVQAGAEAAVGDSGYAQRPFSDRRTIAMMAVPVLAESRHYDEARALVAAADMQTVVQGLFPPHFLAMLRARRLDTTPPPPDSPAGVAARYLRGTLVVNSDAAALEPLFSESARRSVGLRALIERDIEVFARGRRAAQGRAAGGPVLMSEVGIASLSFEVEGPEPGPRRVEVRWNGQVGSILYAVRESAGWRIAAARDRPQLIGLAALQAIEQGDLNAARRWVEWARRDHLLRAERGAEAVMPRIAATAVGPDDVAVLRLTAAFLLASGPAPLLTDARLEAVRKEIRTDEQRYLLDLVQLESARQQRDPATMARLAPRIAAVRPDTEEAMRVQVAAAMAGQRWVDAEAVLRGWLVAHPDSFAGKQLLATNLTNQGRVEDALALLAADAGQVAVQGDGDGDTDEMSRRLNNYAWQALCAERVDDAAIDAARRGHALRPSFSVSHTLASLLAARGRVKDAFAALDAALTSEPAAVLDDTATAFVHALAAESVGARDTALAAYRIAAADTNADASSVGSLARKRLQRLESAPPPVPSPVPRD